MLILVGNETISAQTYQFSGSTSIKCGAENCMITIPYTIYATDDNQTECGQWNFSVSFGTITDPCSKITGIDNFQWKNISFPQGSVYDTYGETVHGQNVDFHLPDDTDYDIELKFTVHTLCGDYHPTRNFEVTQEDECSGCTASFCYEEAFCGANEPFAVTINSIVFYDNQQFHSFSTGNSYYNGPYYIYGGGICQISPNIYDLIDDLNDFLDGQHFGHAVLKYYDSDDPGYDLCKLKIRVRESDLMMYLVRSENYEIEMPGCEPTSTPLCEPTPHIIVTSTESDDCIEQQMTIPQGLHKLNEAKLHQTLLEGNEYFGSAKDADFEFKVFPNFTFDYIEVSVNSISPSTFSCTIIDFYGQILFETNEMSNNQNTKIDLSNLPSGMYFVKLSDLNTGKHKTQRLVKL